MVDLIRTAWDVEADKVVGGPGWVTKDMFDVIATAPADTSPDALKLMLQGLLKDRFGLAVHNDNKDYPAYAMTVGKKPLLKAAEGTEETGCKVQQSNSPPQEGGRTGFIVMSGSNGTVTRLSLDAPMTFACRNITMAAFADAIRNDLLGAYAYLSGNPVVDRTGLAGAWNFDVKFSFRLNGLMVAGAPAADTITLFDAFEKQLGLKLDLVKVSRPVVAIDSVNEKPTANPPEVAATLPAPPTEFEVAAIKPTDPKATANPGALGFVMPYTADGRVNLRNYTLKNLIMLAWSLSNADMILGGPKSLDTAHWDIVAKAPTPDLAPGTKAVGMQIDYASMMLMMQALLKDRFKLQMHNEDRSANGYALVAVKPKLRKADPSNRPECKEGPGPDGKDPRIANPDASRLVTCLNMTLGEFATELRTRASGYLMRYPPVVDATGIEGRYDITINFSVMGMAVGGRGMGAAAPAGAPLGGDVAAAEPSGAITVFEALEKQLGLKLEARKVTTSALVIDHAEDAPTEN